MDDKFDIVSIPAEKFIFNKQLDGIIAKGWVETSKGRALFKQAAQVPSDLSESRTDWSEKITAELASRIQLPAAKYEFAQVESPDLIIPGSISTDLSNPGEKRIPLAEILDESIIDYDYAFNYEVSQVIQVLSEQDIKIPPGYKLPEGINDGVDMFVGVLMLDAYVGNTDRHDQNLDIVQLEDGTSYLSPVFDHGFSLGAVLDDRMRENNSPQRYSEVFSDSSFSIDGVDVSGLEAFEEAAKLRPQAAKIWQNQLSQIRTQEIRELFVRIPEDRITSRSRDFASDLLSHNQSQLLSLNLSYQQNISLAPQNISARASTLDTSKPIEDVKFELASSAKYIAFKQGKEIIDSVDGVTIEKQDNLSIRYEGKLIEFDRDFNVISNEFSDRELRQLNQKVQVNKQQLKEQSQQINRDRKIQRDNGLSL
ncbi:hypothetical protein I4641_02360 [Waterburya agarophytonicola K14]|uniref:Uncharacterized protein n=1 Tax=Waterburya agarophytonicola KI4 TaxID=2874699 RepID=A0A964BMC4_9CYAN|nr:hypothetical protein [Waterburya agarophytonicola]MCC0175824.1 hypothetical protein [Waterburya agarophytonicola KI4]